MTKYIYIIISFFLIVICQSSLFAQMKEGDLIKGTVTAKNSKEPLIGITVKEINAENRVVSGTVTDMNGQFVLKIKNPANKLSLSYVGFKTQIIAISEKSVINVQMEDESYELGTVTVTAKQTRNTGIINIPTREISTAMQKISAEEFEGVQVTSLDEALQGRIAGMDIVANSGDPGSGTTIRIRGASSMNADKPPLIVINNIPFEQNIDTKFDYANANQDQYANMLSINPDDIEDITVLKDAASTAIWGSKGANGVIMVNTKKGKYGPTKLQYTYRLTQSVQPKGINLLNGNDYTMMMKQAKFNPIQNESASNINEYSYNPEFTEYQQFNNNTDWVAEVTQTGTIHDHYLSASGGGERANYRVSGGFLNQTGTVIGQKLNRVSSRAELDYRVSDRLRFSSEVSFTYSDNDRNWRMEDNDNNKMSLLAIAYAKMPNLSVYLQDSLGNNSGIYYNIRQNADLDGFQKGLKNPVALAYLAKNNLKNFRITPTLRLQYSILDPQKQNLKYNMYISLDMNNDKVSTFLPREASNYPDDSYMINLSTYSDVQNLSVQTDHNITWVPKFRNEKHAMVLYSSFQATTGSSTPLGIASYGVPSSQITDASVQSNLIGMGSLGSQWRSLAFLGNMHYAFKEKYILDLIMRRDGSTKFGPGNKWGNFPGISAKWIISDEPFMKSSGKWLNMLAFRPSWGESGNQPKYEGLFYSRYASYGNYIDIGAIRPVSPQLSNLKWEKTSSFNLGMDIEFFNGKYIFDLNYYYKRTDDLLQEKIGMPESSGYSQLTYMNVGSVENKGWEVNFNGKIIKSGDFTFDFNFNMGNNKNTILSLSPQVLKNVNPEYRYNNGEYLSRVQENNSLGSIYGFRYKGVYQYDKYIPGIQESAPVARNERGEVVYDETGVTPVPMVFGYGVRAKNTPMYTFKGGDAIYEDINHDGSIDNLDIVYLGNSNPKLNGGFTPSLSYKQFRITAFFVFRYGNKIVNTARMDLENMYFDKNQSIAVNYRWRKDGDVTEIPRALYLYGYNWLGSDRFVEDGSFLRLKDLTLRYNANSKVLAKLYVKTLNFYLTINNIFVLTKYTGVDPEVGYGDWGVSKDDNKTPRSKGFTTGITIGL